MTIFHDADLNIDAVVKGLKSVMPDLIRHPEHTEYAGRRFPDKSIPGLALSE
jgi:hypothetical protein